MQCIHREVTKIEPEKKPSPAIDIVAGPGHFKER